MKKRSFFSLLICGVLMFFTALPVSACTGFIVGGDLTENGNTIFGRTEDLSINHSKVYKLNEAGMYKEGSKIVCAETGYEFTFPHDSYRFTSIGDYPQDEGIFDEAGFNERGLAVDMTVSAKANAAILAVDGYEADGGLAEATMPTVVLATAATAREGVELLAKELASKGSADGNIAVLADKNELWYMEIYSGHQFFALKYPRDQFSVFPNTFWLGRVTIDGAEEKDSYVVSNGGEFIFSKELVSTAEAAHTFRGEKDGATVTIDLSASYAPALGGFFDSNRTRVYSGIKHLNPDANISANDPDYDLFHDAPTGSISLKQVMELTRNRMENVPENGNDRSFIGNRRTMEAHIFEFNPNDQTTEQPGRMWLAIGTPLMSPYVAYYPHQTSGFAKAMNDEGDRSSVYWTAMKSYFTAEQGDLKENLSFVKYWLGDLQDRLIANAVSPTTDAESATANNVENAKTAYEAMLDVAAALKKKVSGKAPIELRVDVEGNQKVLKLFAGEVATVETPEKLHYHFAGWKDTDTGLMIDLTKPLQKTTNVSAVFDNGNYRILSGDNLKTQATEQYSEIICDAPHDNFLGVLIDGQPLDEKHFTHFSGSTVVRLHHAYLSTLGPKDYTVTLLFKDGNVSTTLHLLPVASSSQGSTGNPAKRLVPNTSVK